MSTTEITEHLWTVDGGTLDHPDDLFVDCCEDDALILVKPPYGFVDGMAAGPDGKPDEMLNDRMVLIATTIAAALTKLDAVDA